MPSPTQSESEPPLAVFFGDAVFNGRWLPGVSVGVVLSAGSDAGRLIASRGAEGFARTTPEPGKPSIHSDVGLGVYQALPRSGTCDR